MAGCWTPLQTMGSGSILALASSHVKNCNFAQDTNRVRCLEADRLTILVCSRCTVSLAIESDKLGIHEQKARQGRKPDPGCWRASKWEIQGSGGLSVTGMRHC